MATAATALGLGGVAAAGSPALAAGGCAEHWAAGYEMGVCINDGNTGFHKTYSDVYVNTVPSGSPSCDLYIEVWNDSGKKYFQNGSYSCSGYQKAPSHIEVPGCELLHTSVWITVNGTFYRVGDSPQFWFGDSCG